MKITIAIPTYNRGAILVQTVERLLALAQRANEIVIADQTKTYDPAIESRLAEWSKSGAIRWIRLPEPSIPHAMNEALRAAQSPVVLFLDDDIEPSPDLVEQHARAQDDASIWAIAGQVLQPGEEPRHHPRPANDLEFRFNHDEACDVANVMAGNLSVKRERALQIGGFDENYIGAAYRFETDFAVRVVAAGGRIRFEPAATLRHLKLSAGGLRSFGDHRVSASPLHSVGDYYFAMHHVDRFWRYAMQRMVRNVATRFHLRHPWTIPTKITAELRGLLLARRLARGGQRLGGNLSSAAGLPSNTDP